MATGDQDRQGPHTQGTDTGMEEAAKSVDQNTFRQCHGEGQAGDREDSAGLWGLGVRDAVSKLPPSPLAVLT